MDGVLVDSEPMHLDAMRRVLTPYGVAYTDRENAEFFGFTDPEVFGILRARYGLAPEPLELTRRRTELLVALTRKGTVPMPGVPDIPRALHGRGYRLAIASSSAPVVIRATVEALGIASVFEALVSGLDVGRGKPAPTIDETTAVAPEVVRRVAGRYTADGKNVDLIERDGRLFLYSTRAEFRLELRSLGDTLVIDSPAAYGIKVQAKEDLLTLGTTTYKRTTTPRPEPAPARWAGLIGEYGWDHDILYILEKDGKLWVLIEWFCYYPLEEISENVFKFPSYGLYESEKLIFKRDAAGRAQPGPKVGSEAGRTSLTGVPEATRREPAAD